jgi:ribonuclease HI
MKKLYEVYTDGACSNNQGEGGQPGGWGVVFVDGRTFAGAKSNTTNNRMELQAAIEALKQTEVGSHVKLHSDSAYLINAFTQGWLTKWQLNGWRTAQNKPVENQDLWNELVILVRDREVEWVKVKAHADDDMNNLADSLAVGAILDNSKKTRAKSKIDDAMNLNLSREELQLLYIAISEKAETDPNYSFMAQILKKKLT